MTNMLTLFGKNLKHLNYDDLDRELRSQRYVLNAIKRSYKIEAYKLNKRREEEEESGIKPRKRQVSEDKIALCETYIAHLETLIRELEYRKTLRPKPTRPGYSARKAAKLRERNKKAERARTAERVNDFNFQRSIERDGMSISWDKDKFLLIARDRGYQTEQALVYEMSKELNMTIDRASIILNRGRMTWGQVLCLGAMMQMSPKEFCDTFLAGYFIDHGDDEYRADYTNLNKAELLKRAIKPQSKDIFEGIEEVEIDVGADGKPLDEEEWF